MNVLIAVDGSKYSRWEFEWLTKLPFAVPLKIIALHVIDIPSVRAPFMAQPVILGSQQYIRKEIQQLEVRGKQALAEAKTLMASLKLRGKVAKDRGAVAVQLLRRVPKRNGLLVIGSRGLDALDRFMLGSVSTHMTNHAPCSVLIVKEEARPIGRVLFATDGSKASEKALDFLLTKLRPHVVGASGEHTAIEVVVTHVMPYFKYPEIKQAGTKLVEQSAEKLIKGGYVVDEAFRIGKPAEEILKMAAQKKTDLIVTGARGAGAVARFLLGSVATKIMQHSHCSVLVVR
ncbi:MAG TPA: universal stress protein [Nitrospiraceae bacterium]|jgi:nucleotide-binding universal stress UspA family protein